MNTQKSDSSLTAHWVNFFTAAGIPSDVSATYALTFTENRIQNDMLLDLNKEYLRDMGISRMGDVIAILRHAKQVHESAARDRVLGAAGAGAKLPVAAVAGRLTVSQNKPASPAHRILEHYTRQTDPSSPTVCSTVSSATINTSPQHKRKIADAGCDMLDVKKSRLIRFSSATLSKPPSLHPPHATPNKEGMLTKTVFSRLGNTEPGYVKASVITASAQAKPIFARLGAKSISDETIQTIPIQKDALKYEGILKSPPPSNTVMVTTTMNNIRRIACTMRADERPISIKDKLAIPKPKSVKFSNHVQYKEIEPNNDRVVKTNPQNAIQSQAARPLQPMKMQLTKTLQTTMTKPHSQIKSTSVFNKPERRLSMPDESIMPSKSGVKSRLGSKNGNLTITTNIFNRLGV